MIGTILGLGMIAAGCISVGWGTWRCSRPVLFWRRMRESQLSEIGAGRWSGFLERIERQRNAGGDEGRWSATIE